MNRRILIVDDSDAIHNDFREVLGVPANLAVMSDAKAALLGGDVEARLQTKFELTHASQGQEALQLVEKAAAEDSPFAMAFVDVRMPPGWDAIETLERLWQVDPTMQAVICTAFSDYSWDEMVNRLGDTDKLLILRKPFDNIEAAACRCSNQKMEAGTRIASEARLPGTDGRSQNSRDCEGTRSPIDDQQGT
ncbi:MAG: hypothetical protein CMJ64_00865 [Planctomycetaceae bacterium]|jgi:CheY-like chemotaxis protein|nr:hypothetical protein [Planctomycetaceae bacterium]